MLLILFELLGLVASTIFLQKIEQARVESRRFQVTAPADVKHLPSMTIVIPAYNESLNIVDCVTAALGASDRLASEYQVWVVDDDSQDDTLKLAQAISDPRLKVVAGLARPVGETWMGKNWACAQVTDSITTDYILFLDADVRLRSGSVDRAVAFAAAQQTDLLSCWVTLTCGCWGEWLCQPIVASMFAAAFEFPRVNDPEDPMVMAVGPFMLFRRSAYEAIGGHRAMAAEIVEDVGLARRIQQAGLKYWYGLGLDLGDVQMYRSLPSLWEGWSKNWHLGSQRQVGTTLYSSLVVFLIYVMPAIGLLGSLTAIGTGLTGLTLLFSLVGLGLHAWIRSRVMLLSGISLKYWWITTLGGAIFMWVPIASLIKTETGWGWTWRGRSLKTIPTGKT
jgi:cellulose synthase/poly-beta-1,6-N-acetylglucosamine synthase-like glycosyltransferase